MSLPRLVLDTNILISAAFGGNTPPVRTVRMALTQAEILLDEPLSKEYDRLLNPKFDRYSPRDHRQRLIDEVRRKARWIEHDLRLEACRDPKDDMVLSLAVAGEAAFIITGDKDLLTLHPFEGIEIIQPRELLERVG